MNESNIDGEVLDVNNSDSHDAVNSIHELIIE